MGYKIRECRKEKKMSQCELAEKSGVSRTVISGLECGSITTTTKEINVKRSDNVQINQQPRPWIGLVQS